ncbi:MAG TPA: LemA family protein [Bacilli bacterium]
MRKSSIAWIIAGVLVVILILSSVSAYNGMVTAQTNVDKQFSQIENTLQRRADLIPNLVNTVKGYAAHEKEVLQSIADARSKLVGANTPAQMAAADSELSSALSRLLVVVENYPDLKADKEFTRLMDELSGTENRIAVARKDYNDAVEQYNLKIRRFPGSLFASMFGFAPRDFFKSQPGAEKVPEVKF